MEKGYQLIGLVRVRKHKHAIQILRMLNEKFEPATQVAFSSMDKATVIEIRMLMNPALHGELRNKAFGYAHGIHDTLTGVVEK